MSGNHYAFSARVNRFPGFASWHYVVLPEQIVKQIKKKFGYIKRGWGSFPIKATLGSTVWTTSIFPHQAGSYFLALKADVRKKENISQGDSVNLYLEIKDDIFS